MNNPAKEIANFNLIISKLLYRRIVLNHTDSNAVYLLVARDCFYLKSYLESMKFHDFKYLPINRSVIDNFTSENLNRYLSKKELDPLVNSLIWVDLGWTGETFTKFAKKCKFSSQSFFLFNFHPTRFDFLCPIWLYPFFFFIFMQSREVLEFVSSEPKGPIYSLENVQDEFVEIIGPESPYIAKNFEIYDEYRKLLLNETSSDLKVRTWKLWWQIAKFLCFPSVNVVKFLDIKIAMDPRHLINKKLIPDNFKQIFDKGTWISGFFVKKIFKILNV